MPSISGVSGPSGCGALVGRWPLAATAVDKAASKINLEGLGVRFKLFGRDFELLSWSTSIVCSFVGIKSFLSTNSSFFGQFLADCLQFLSTLLRGLRICHLETLERVEDNTGHNEPRVVLIIGGNGVPRRVTCAGRVQAILIRFHVMLPVFSLVIVRGADFPVFVGHVDARKKAFALFFVRKV